MIIVISNRNVNPEYNNEYLFGELPNELGGNTIRIAKADYNSSNNPWTLELIPEDNGTTIPSQELFEEIATHERNWVFYIPGFNQSSRSALDASQKLSKDYQVDVMLFSWPSNPKGDPRTTIEELFNAKSEYEKALLIAEHSAKALNKAVTIFKQNLVEPSFNNHSEKSIKFTLLVHSLGNYVFENYIKSSSNDITEIFDNIILHQADVHNKNHKDWIDKIKISKNIYITININDTILVISGAYHRNTLFHTKSNRLGNNTTSLNATKPIYIDFTSGRYVDKAHNLFFEVGNPIIVNFFKQIFKGTTPKDVLGSPQFEKISDKQKVYKFSQP